MSHRRIFTWLAAVSLILALPLGALAQDEVAPEGEVSPEGNDWALTGYFDEETFELIGVPFGVPASLLLEEGAASGSGGCNTFSGSYEIDGSTLVFGELARTLKLCGNDVQAVEDAYLALLPLVDGWSIVDGVLQLSDEVGDTILTFEIPNVVLTAGQLNALLGQLLELRAGIDAVNERVNNANIPRLRERIKTLETDNKDLKDQLADARRAPRTTPAPEPITFNKAERVLLEGIPQRIAGRCVPARNELLGGTVAAVSCRPNTTSVSSLTYFLMEGKDAFDHFEAQMSLYDVSEATASRTCDRGRPAYTYRNVIGTGFKAEGCARESGGGVVQFFVDDATACKQLTAGGTRLRSPAYFIRLDADHSDIARTYQWATRDAPGGRMTSIANVIPRPNAKKSPGCLS